MPRLSLLWLWGERGGERLTTLERPAFLLRLPLFLLATPSSSLRLAFCTPYSSFSLAFSSTDSRRFVSPRIVNVSPECRAFPSSSRYSFSSAPLSKHRFVSIYSLFVHSESFALIVKVKWDSRKQRFEDAPQRPSVLFQWAFARAPFCGLAFNESAAKSSKYYDVLRKGIGEARL